MKGLLILLPIFMGSVAMASDMQIMRCEVSVVVDSAVPVVQSFDLISADQPHGALETFKLPEFDGITGLLGLLPGDEAVMSLYSDKLEIGSSSHGTVAGGKIASHLLILPSPGMGTNSIAIKCQYLP